MLINGLISPMLRMTLIVGQLAIWYMCDRDNSALRVKHRNTIAQSFDDDWLVAIAD